MLGKSPDANADQPSLEQVRKILLIGAAGAALYATAFVAWSGVVVDEVVRAAQVISGDVRYPAGHPDGIYYPGAFSLSNYAAAAIWFFVPSAYALSALRNVAWVWGSVFVPFAVGSVLTRSASWATLAAVLSVCEVAVNFEGAYPMRVWPLSTSHGAFGADAAIVTLVLWVVRSWTFAGFLLGLLPSLHAAMTLPVWPWAIAMALLKRGPQGRVEWRRFARGVGGGMALCSVVLVLSLRRELPAPAEPYVVSGNGDHIRAEFVDHYDGHRRAFDIVSRAYLLGPVALGLAGGLALWGQRRGRGLTAQDRRAWAAVLSLVAVSWAEVYASRVTHAMWDRLPLVLDVLMPYRLSNLSALLLPSCLLGSVAVALRSLSPRLSRRALWVGLLVLMTATAWLAAATVVGRWNEWERVALHAPFVLVGLLIGIRAQAREDGASPRLPPVVATGVVALLALVPAWRHSVVIAMVVALVTFLTVRGRCCRRTPVINRARWMHALAALSCVCLLGAGLARGKNWSARQNALLRFDSDARALSAWLRKNAEPREMVLEPLEPVLEIQARTGQPVLFDRETLQTMTYLPRLAGTVGAMVRDLYGIDFSRPDELGGLRAGRPETWVDNWGRRSREQWLDLARLYGFRLVVSPKDLPLSLPVALPGPAWTLYEIR